MEDCIWFATTAGLLPISEDMDIVPYAVDRVESNNTTGPEKLLIHHLLQHVLSIVKNLLGFLAYKKN